MAVRRCSIKRGIAKERRIAQEGFGAQDAVRARSLKTRTCFSERAYVAVSEYWDFKCVFDGLNIRPAKEEVKTSVNIVVA